MSAHLEGDVVKFPAVAQRRSAGINQSRGRSGGSGQTFPRPPTVSPAARRTFGAPGAHFPFHCLLPGHDHLFSRGWVEQVSPNTFPPWSSAKRRQKFSRASRTSLCLKKGRKVWTFSPWNRTKSSQLLSRSSSWMVVNPSSASLCKHLSLLPLSDWDVGSSWRCCFCAFKGKSHQNDKVKGKYGPSDVPGVSSTVVNPSDEQPVVSVAPHSKVAWNCFSFAPQSSRVTTADVSSCGFISSHHGDSRGFVKCTKDTEEKWCQRSLSGERTYSIF